MTWVGILVAAYAGICLLVFTMQDRLVFLPGGPPSITPDSLGLKYRDLTLMTEDGLPLHAWLIQAADSKGTVLVCNGNAGNISNRLGLASAFVEMGLDVLLFDYRGYGKSKGGPDEDGLYLDAMAAYDFLTRAESLPPGRLVTFGESLGGAIAIELARRQNMACVITQSAFTSLPDVGAEIYPWLPVRWLARIDFRSIEKVPTLGIPFLITHSTEDELIPYSHAQALFEKASDPKELLPLTGRHNDGGILHHPEYRKKVEDFIFKWLKD